MAMERFLTALVFCEGPLDAAFYGATTSTSVATGVKKLVVSGAGSTGSTKPAPADKADAGKKWWAQRQAGYELAFDGLNCFETVVMH